MMAELKEKLQSSQQQLLLLKGRRFIETWNFFEAPITDNFCLKKC